MSTYSAYKYVPRFIIQKDRRQQLARKSETDVSESRHARECDMRVSMHEIALSSIFFFYTGTRRRISEFHQRPRLPDLRSIPKPKDEAAKPQIAQGPRHLI